jgi:hypothetical protein
MAVAVAVAETMKLLEMAKEVLAILVVALVVLVDKIVLVVLELLEIYGDQAEAVAEAVEITVQAVAQQVVQQVVLVKEAQFMFTQNIKKGDHNGYLARS